MKEEKKNKVDYNRTLLTKYGELKIKEKQIADELEMLKDQVLDEVRAISTDQPVQIAEVGTYSIGRRKNWRFSPIVEQLQAKLEETKKEQMATGAATFTEQEYVIFKKLLEVENQ